jgi:hypothetical protein
MDTPHFLSRFLPNRGLVFLQAPSYLGANNIGKMIKRQEERDPEFKLSYFTALETTPPEYRGTRSQDMRVVTTTSRVNSSPDDTNWWIHINNMCSGTTRPYLATNSSPFSLVVSHYAAMWYDLYINKSEQAKLVELIILFMREARRIYQKLKDLATTTTVKDFKIINMLPYSWGDYEADPRLDAKTSITQHFETVLIGFLTTTYPSLFETIITDPIEPSMTDIPLDYNTPLNMMDTCAILDWYEADNTWQQDNFTDIRPRCDTVTSGDDPTSCPITIPRYNLITNIFYLG